MASRTPIRNTSAKPLPYRWRNYLVEEGCPKRKYTAVCRVMLADGRTFDDLVVEEGWIVTTTREGLEQSFPQEIPFDPAEIVDLEMVLYV